MGRRVCVGIHKNCWCYSHAYVEVIIVNHHQNVHHTLQELITKGETIMEAIYRGFSIALLA